MNAKLDFIFETKDSQKAVLLFHGLTGSPFEMRQYGKYLFKSGFDVYCPTLPGHGENIDSIQKARWQEWVKFSLEQYKKLKLTYNEVYVAGLCMGAVLALAIAEEHKDVSGIISLSTTLFLDGWTMPWYKFLMPLGLNTVLKYYYTFPENDPYGIKNETVRKKISALLKENTVAFDRIPMSCVFELLELSKFVRKRISRVSCPILVIHSEYDNLTSLKSASFVYNNISSQRKEFIKLNDSYHLIIMDNEKDYVFSKSVDFLNLQVAK